MTPTDKTTTAVLDQLDIAWGAIEAARQVLLLEDGRTQEADTLLVLRDGIDSLKLRLSERI